MGLEVKPYRAFPNIPALRRTYLAPYPKTEITARPADSQAVWRRLCGEQSFSNDFLFHTTTQRLQQIPIERVDIWGGLYPCRPTRSYQIELNSPLAPGFCQQISCAEAEVAWRPEPWLCNVRAPASRLTCLEICIVVLVVIVQFSDFFPDPCLSFVSLCVIIAYLWLQSLFSPRMGVQTVIDELHSMFRNLPCPG